MEIICYPRNRKSQKPAIDVALRLINSFRFCLRSQRPKVKPGPKHIFQPIITESHAPLMEIDINFHKTNSSYFSDVDVVELTCSVPYFPKELRSSEAEQDQLQDQKNLRSVLPWGSKLQL
ncbi:hypothetical protein DID88_010361 [Monilinia fructigena]|uniref:Uncharacterized protein n=1 Tax=Monilinia fructigena TaxID=38457 RepID=A0A395ILP6_9HELO|nr:hypothetical protein DID88_010361 [Monilinia fructigena]